MGYEFLGGTFDFSALKQGFSLPGNLWGGGPFSESPFSASVLAPTPWKGAKNANWTLLFPSMYKRFITDGYFQNSKINFENYGGGGIRN